MTSWQVLTDLGSNSIHPELLAQGSHKHEKNQEPRKATKKSLVKTVVVRKSVLIEDAAI